VERPVVHAVRAENPVLPPVGRQGHVEHVVADRTREVVEEDEPVPLHRQRRDFLPQLLFVRRVGHDREPPAGQDEGDHVGE
jgi:hypothetical protein